MTAPNIPNDLATLQADFNTLSAEYQASQSQLATAQANLADAQVTNAKVASQITGAGYTLPDGVTITPALVSPTAPVLPETELGAHSNASRTGIAPGTSIAYLKQIGATVHRMDYRLCDSVPTTSDVYSPSFDATVDAIITDAQAAKIDTILCLWGNPPWASGFSTVPAGAPAGADLHGCWPAPGSAQETVLIGAWVALGTRVAARYKGKVKKYELWNEENQGFCWWQPNPAQYARWLVAVASAIKAVDPTNVVVIGGICGIGAGPVYSYGSNGAAFLKAVYAELAARKFTPDGVAIHPYGPAQTALVPGGDSYGDIATIYAIMQANGQDPAKGQAVLWVTETGDTAVGSDVTTELALLASTFPYVSVWCWFLLANNPANPNDKWPGAMFNAPGAAAGTITPVGTAFQKFVGVA